MRRKATFGEHRLHVLIELPLPQLACRYVHGHIDAASLLDIPVRRIAAGAAKHPLSERDDQVAVFRHGHEFARGDFSVDRMDPAQQGLRADYAARAAVELRLINEVQRVGFDRFAQFRSHTSSNDNACLMGRTLDGIATPASRADRPGLA